MNESPTQLTLAEIEAELKSIDEALNSAPFQMATLTARRRELLDERMARNE